MLNHCSVQYFCYYNELKKLFYSRRWFIAWVTCQAHTMKEWFWKFRFFAIFSDSAINTGRKCVSQVSIWSRGLVVVVKTNASIFIETQPKFSDFPIFTIFIKFSFDKISILFKMSIFVIPVLWHTSQNIHIQVLSHNSYCCWTDM